MSFLIDYYSCVTIYYKLLWLGWSNVQNQLKIKPYSYKCSLLLQSIPRVSNPPVTQCRILYMWCLYLITVLYQAFSFNSMSGSENLEAQACNCPSHSCSRDGQLNPIRLSRVHTSVSDHLTKTEGGKPYS